MANSFFRDDMVEYIGSLSLSRAKAPRRLFDAFGSTGSRARIMFSALSNVKVSKQLEEPADDPLPEPFEMPFSMSQASLLSHAPSYRTYAQDLPPGQQAAPDRNLHDYGRHRLHAFLHAVAERPRILELEVFKRRGEPMARWRRHRTGI